MEKCKEILSKLVEVLNVMFQLSFGLMGGIQVESSSETAVNMSLNENFSNIRSLQATTMVTME